MKKSVAIIFSLFLIACEESNFITNKWYNYGNGKINLKNVTTVRPTINAKVTLSSEDDIDYTEYTEPLNIENISKYKKYFSEESIKNQDFYRLEIGTYIMFDSFSVQIFKSDVFYKKPINYKITDEMIALFSAQGAPESMIRDLKKLKSNNYFSIEELNEDLDALGIDTTSQWYAQEVMLMALSKKSRQFLERFKDEKVNELTADSIKNISDQLDLSLKHYISLPI